MGMREEKDFIAHFRVADGAQQELREHLLNVGNLAGQYAEKVGLKQPAELIGTLHDLGKYSGAFQAYLRSAVGLLNQDEDVDFVDAGNLKGKIDHSTAGAQLVWSQLSGRGPVQNVVGQILSLCIASHHSGLIDCLSSGSGPTIDIFHRRMAKGEEFTHLAEAMQHMDAEVRKKAEALIEMSDTVTSLEELIAAIAQTSPSTTVACFKIGFLVRFLFSCLIDGDRTDTASFELPHVQKDLSLRKADWSALSARLESHLATMEIRHAVDHLRKRISDDARSAASREPGIFTLTVPTGGGKTLAALRFALNHARCHDMNQIIVVLPFTSIIDQNADVVRRVLEVDARDKGRIVLEHHSNLAPETQSWNQKLLAETWNTPIVFTTTVQLLETFFGAGTRGARRLHKLAKSIVVFDEIQALPVRCIHLFNNAVNFLSAQCRTTVVLCTATQPLLHRVEANKGALDSSPENEIVADAAELFRALKRVDAVDLRRPGGWTARDVATLALERVEESRSCLTIVNTKKAARRIMEEIPQGTRNIVCHLSTSMCPVHRREILSRIKSALAKEEKVLCVSTQLIEAGVDVDFGDVIRYLAGLDSMAQAAGRCNRNGKREKGNLFIVNPADENLQHLPEIAVGRDNSQRVMDEIHENPARFDNDLLGLKSMAWYYENYFFARRAEMSYPVKQEVLGRADTLLDLLAENPRAVSDYQRVHGSSPDIFLRQSFMTAARSFQAIDGLSRGIVVSYGAEGAALVADLCSAGVEQQARLLRKAQQYSVNVFRYEFDALLRDGAIAETQPGSDVYHLDPQYYSKQFGLSLEPVNPMELLHV